MKLSAKRAQSEARAKKKRIKNSYGWMSVGSDLQEGLVRLGEDFLKKTPGINVHRYQTFQFFFVWQ